jgi:hypothetical protein
MSQDLRELFKSVREESKPSMQKDHEERFLKRLEEELPKKEKSTFLFFKIAASALLLLTAGYFTWNAITETTDIEETIVDTEQGVEDQKGISLGDLSPDLKKLENYYVANINLELSKLEVSDDTKTLVDGFMNQLQELDVEYDPLHEELNKRGPNAQTLSALIQHVQLR